MARTLKILLGALVILGLIYLLSDTLKDTQPTQFPSSEIISAQRKLTKYLIPLPEGGLILNQTEEPTTNSFEVQLSFPGLAEEAEAYYQQQLSAVGWQLQSSTPLSGGTVVPVVITGVAEGLYTIVQDGDRSIVVFSLHKL